MKFMEEEKQMIKKENIFPIGIGTFRIDLNEKAKSMNALELGQNYIDTSHLYENGKVMAFLGEFINQVGRDNIFITTKIEPTVEKITDIEEQLNKYLEIMNRMVEIGKAKTLGLSNSTLEQLKEVHSNYPISIYEGIYNLECKINEDIGIIEYCKNNHILFCAYQPLRRNRTANKNYPLLVELANKYNKTQNQIILNWILKEKSINILIKTTNVDRIEENIESLNFEINKEDYDKLNMFRAKEFDDLEIDWQGNGGVTIDQVANHFG